MKETCAGKVFAIMCLTGFPFAAHADVSAAWNQDADGHWAVGNNWSDGSAATGTTGVATFSNAITANRTVTVDSSPWTINGMIFNSGVTYGWTITGGMLDLAGIAPSVTVYSGNTAKIVSVLSGSAGLTKSGAGALTLSGANTYSGATTLSDGTLQIGDGTSATANAGSGALAVNSKTLNLNLNGPATLANSSVTSSGLIQNVGVGKVTLTNGVITGTVDGGNAGIVLAKPITADFLSRGDLTLSTTSSGRTLQTIVAGTTIHIVDCGVFWWIGTTFASSASTLDIAAGVTVTLASGQGAGSIFYTNLTGSGSFTFDGDAKAVGYLLGFSTLSGTLTAKRPFSFGNGGAGGMAGSTKIDSTATGSVIFNSTTDNTYSGNMSGAGALIKTNTNMLTLSGIHSYSGSTTISGGTLVLDGGAVLGAGSYAGMIVNNGEFRFGSSADQTLSGGISGTGTLIKNGTGALTLVGYNAYSGPTQVNGGKLVGMTGGSCPNSHVTMAEGTINGIAILVYGESWDCASLTYTGNATLDFDLGSLPVNAALAPLQVNGDLNVTGTVSVAVRNGFWSSTGIYPLVSYTGDLNGSGSFTLASLPAGLEASLITDTEHKRLDLSVTAVPTAGGAVSVWTRLDSGNASGDWGNSESWSGTIPNAVDAVADFTTLNIGTTSYVNNNALRTVGALRFADTAASHDWNVTNATLTLATSLGMPVVTVSNQTATFLSGLAAPQGFIKNGAGTLKLSGLSANSFGDQIFVSAGTLAVYKGASLQNAAGPLIVPSGACLNIDGGYDGIPVASTVYLGGSGVGSQGALNLENNQNMSGPILLTADSRITFKNNPNIKGSITALGNGKNLEFHALGMHALYVSGSMNLGTGVLTVNSVPSGPSVQGFVLTLQAANTFSGGTVLTGYAALRMENAGALGSGGVTLSPNTRLDLYANSITIPWLSGTGGFITDTIGTSGTDTLTVNQSTDTVYSGVISNGVTRVLALVKTGTGSLALSGTNTYTGATAVSNGTLCVSGSLATASLTVCTGGVFAVGATGVVNRANLVGTLTFMNNSRLLVDVSAAAADTVSVSGNVVIGSNVELRVSDDQTNSGNWKVVESTAGTLSGDFVLVGGVNKAAKLTKVENAVWLEIPPKGTVIQIR